MFLRILLTVSLLLLTIPAQLWSSDVAPGLTQDMAAEFLREIEGEVISVEPSEIPGFSRVGMKIQGQVIPLYLHNSGSYLFSGNVIDLKHRKNLTEEHFRQLNPVALDQIPLDDALSLGSPTATIQVIVFTDPDCPFCSQLHHVISRIVEERPDIVFHIKLTPLKESSYQTAKSIVCNKSMDQLELAFSGAPVPVSECASDAIDNNLTLAKELGIHGTPTLVLPNGQLAPGYRPQEELLKLIEENKAQ
ncbi:MAG: DsbC family protein [Desulfuromonadales bacterium]|nr:DsbC family protein [Desulfuromonadales bacterium]MBN2791244.1 DsbC family protein [Desulfuromonadales bacterium]